MITQLTTFGGGALALELTGIFTKEDEQFLIQLFEEKLNAGYGHVNLLLKVKDLSVLKNMDLKVFLESEIWGFKHFRKIGKCAVVAQSDFIKNVVAIENKMLHLANPAFEEKYFDWEQLDEALRFINPEQ